MLFRSFITISCIFAASVSAFIVPRGLSKGPLLAKKNLKADAYKRNQYNPRLRKASRTLGANRSNPSAVCSPGFNSACDDSQYCTSTGSCIACPLRNSKPNAAKDGCECAFGYAPRSHDGMDYCLCAQANPATVPYDGTCKPETTCLSGYSLFSSASGPVCTCSFGSTNKEGDCSMCNAGFRETSRNGRKTCVCANGQEDTADGTGTGACVSCDKDFTLLGSKCVPKCSSASQCSGATPFCSAETSTCVAQCSNNSQCSTGNVCSSGSCKASAEDTCPRYFSEGRGINCNDASRCTYTGFCANNRDQGTSSYLGCYAENEGSRAIGTGTAGVDYLFSETLTIAKCHEYCRGKNYSFAALEHNNQCFCDNSNTAAKASERDCYLSCQGANYELCGGDSRLSVYQLK